MLSHVFVGTTDFERALAFYQALMQALGHTLKFIERERPWAAWMPTETPRPLFIVGAPFEGEAHPGNGQMLALQASSRARVNQAYQAALANGGSCAGAPGLRPEYHPHYYGAYLRDPDGNKLCCVCHEPE